MRPRPALHKDSPAEKNNLTNRARAILACLAILSVVPLLFSYATGIGREYGLVEFGFFVALLLGAMLTSTSLALTRKRDRE